MATKKRKLLSASHTMALLLDSPSCASTLQRVHEALLDSSQAAAESFAEDLLSHGFLRLLPSIIRKSSSDGTATGIEILGALSMRSFAIHRKVVSDEDLMRALTESLRSTDLSLLSSACDTVVDLAISSFGCDALRECAVVDHLLRLLCWIADIPTTDLLEGQSARRLSKMISMRAPNDADTCSAESMVKQSTTSTFAFSEEMEELVTSALTAVIALLPDAAVSLDLKRNVLRVLRKYWQNLLARDLIMVEATVADSNSRWTRNRRTRHIVARCIVQLAMEQDTNGSLSPQQGLFDNTDFNLELFHDKYWEHSPLHMKREKSTCVFAFVKRLVSLDALVNDFLAWFVACPPPFGDQLDSVGLLETIDSNLGEPMIYGQDIRMVKTVLSEPGEILSPRTRPETEVEMHYCPDSITSDRQGMWHVRPQDILQALEMGYSVAIKGMELRCPEIADTANCLARQFGQPSVGVNLYLTPPNAQGLDLHFDDHCVFVYQLLGRKIWSVFRAEKILPRLYDHRTLDVDALKSSPSTLFYLEEGDVLYLPRGVPHKARSSQRLENGYDASVPDSRSSVPDGPRINLKSLSGSSCNRTPQLGNICSAFGEQENRVTMQTQEDFTVRENSSATSIAPGDCRSVMDKLSSSCYSLHLTFGLEVEPPFAWEGFLHIALRLWAYQRWQTLRSQSQTDQTNDFVYKHEQLCEAMLHIAIKIVGDEEVVLRKACMVAASTSDCGTRNPRSGQGQTVSTSPKHIFSMSGCGSGESCKSCDASLVEHFQTLVELVTKKASYNEASEFVQDTTDDCSCGMEWLRHIPLSDGQRDILASDPVSFVKSLIHSDELQRFHMPGLEFAFSKMKAEFGGALMFHSASNAFNTVWSKYRAMREKIMNGMLALHNFKRV